MKAGYETWLDAIQPAGGVRIGAGRRAVRVLFADDESEPLAAARQVERLAGNDEVRLFFGPVSNPNTLAVAMSVEKVNGVLVAPDGSAPGLFRRELKTLFSIVTPDDRRFHGLAALAALAQPRAQPVGVLIADDPYLTAASQGFQERASALDLGPVRQELTALGSRDISGALERLAESSPRTIIFGAEPGQISRLTPMVRQLLPLTAMRAFVPLPRPVNPSARPERMYDGALTVESWSPAISSTGPVLGSARDFVERFRRLHGYQPEARAAAAAAAGLALQLGIEAAGSADPPAVRAALSMLDVKTFWGRLGWDTMGRNRVAVAPVLQQQGDGLVAVYPPELANGQIRYPLAGWPAG